jgi:hypothetical protein
MDEQAVPGPFTSQSDTSRAVLGISAISKITQLVITTHDCPGYPAEELKDGNNMGQYQYRARPGTVGPKV